MRLIDADELKLSLCKECTLYPNQCLKDNCAWDSIYHIKIAKTVEAIPIEWIEEWCKCLRENINNISVENFNVYQKRYEEYLKMERLLSMLIEDWRKGNEHK